MIISEVLQNVSAFTFQSLNLSSVRRIAQTPPDITVANGIKKNTTKKTNISVSTKIIFVPLQAITVSIVNLGLEILTPKR